MTHHRPLEAYPNQSDPILSQYSKGDIDVYELLDAEQFIHKYVGKHILEGNLSEKDLYQAYYKSLLITNALEELQTTLDVATTTP